VLQDSDSVQTPNDTHGVTSTALWESLKTVCLHMQRMDLAGLCDAHNLEGEGAASFITSKLRTYY